MTNFVRRPRGRGNPRSNGRRSGSNLEIMVQARLFLSMIMGILMVLSKDKEIIIIAMEAMPLNWSKNTKHSQTMLLPQEIEF